MTFASIGQDVIIWPQAKIAFPDKIVIGNAVIIDDFVLLIGGERTRIGDFVHIGAFTSIAGGGEFIIPGVTIGEGAVVAAGSLVTRDCKAWTTYRGSPARRQGDRPSETILRLEADLCKTAYDARGQYIAKSDRAARVP